MSKEGENTLCDHTYALRSKCQDGTNFCLHLFRVSLRTNHASDPTGYCPVSLVGSRGTWGKQTGSGRRCRVPESCRDSPERDGHTRDLHGTQPELNVLHLLFPTSSRLPLHLHIPTHQCLPLYKRRGNVGCRIISHPWLNTFTHHIDYPSNGSLAGPTTTRVANGGSIILT